MNKRLGRVRFVLGLSSLIVVGLAAGANAHIGAKPASVQAGSTATVTFTVPHGCGGSPTTKLAVKLPSSLGNVKVVAPKGFTWTVNGAVLTLTGGSIPAKSKGMYSLSFQAPTKAGELFFPNIQTCVKGETSWIEPELTGGKESENPAPVVKVTAAKKA